MEGGLRSGRRGRLWVKLEIIRRESQELGFTLASGEQSYRAVWM